MSEASVMHRKVVSLCAAAVAVAVLAQPASALDPLPPSSVVISMQDALRDAAPLAKCIVEVLLTSEHALIRSANAGTTVSGIINQLGIPTDPAVHNLALVTLAMATHGVDKNGAAAREIVQPLEKAATAAAASIAVSTAMLDSAAQKMPNASCAGLAPTVVPTPDIYAISNADVKFSAKRKAIAAYLTPSMAARLARIATTLQNDNSLTSSAAIIASTNSQLNGVVIFTNLQLSMLEYIPIQEALEARLAQGHVTTQLLAFAEALRTLQANFASADDNLVQNMAG
jgi:hypothetical protein